MFVNNNSEQKQSETEARLSFNTINGQIHDIQQKQIINIPNSNMNDSISSLDVKNCPNLINLNQFKNILNFHDSKNINQDNLSKQNDNKNQSEKHFIKKSFSAEEDKCLLTIVNWVGEKNWVMISMLMKQMNYDRNARQCRDRYFHYLDPKIDNKTEWSKEEEELLMKCVEKHGKKWKMMEKILPGRSEVSLRNRYHLVVRKKKRDENGSNRRHNIMSNEFAFLDNYQKKSRRHVTNNNIQIKSKKVTEKNIYNQSISEKDEQKDENFFPVSFDESDIFQLFDDDIHDLFKLDEMYFI